MQSQAEPLAAVVAAVALVVAAVVIAIESVKQIITPHESPRRFRDNKKKALNGDLAAFFISKNAKKRQETRKCSRKMKRTPLARTPQQIQFILSPLLASAGKILCYLWFIASQKAVKAKRLFIIAIIFGAFSVQSRNK